MKRLPLITNTIAISALTLFGLTSVNADTFNYNYAQIGYSFINDFDIDQGIKVSGSYDVVDNINVLGSFFKSTSTDSKIVDDLDVYTLGVGYHVDMSDSTDFLAEIGLLNSSVSTKVGSNDDSGYTLSVGVRHKLKDNIELSARFDHQNTDNVTDNIFTLGSRYYFKSNWSLGFGFNTGADNGSEGITGDLRYQF